MLRVVPLHRVRHHSGAGSGRSDAIPDHGRTERRCSADRGLREIAQPAPESMRVSDAPGPGWICAVRAARHLRPPVALTALHRQAVGTPQPGARRLSATDNDQRVFPGMVDVRSTRGAWWHRPQERPVNRMPAGHEKRRPMAEEMIVPPPSVEDVSPSRDDNQIMDIADEWGMQSFPASDPPQNW